MEYNVKNFGAKGNGIDNDTEAVQKAIDTCNAQGGGYVLIDDGTFMTGTIYLKSNVYLKLTLTGVLRAIPDVELFPKDTYRQMYRKEGHMNRCYIFAKDADNIGIIGEGYVDGQGDKFPKHTRPMLCRYVNCTNIRIVDVHLHNPAAWTNAFIQCTNIMCDRVDIKSRANHNGDGMDFDACKNVIVSNCRFDCSDDCICLQNSTDDIVCEDIVVTNCIFSSRWAGMRIGLLSCGDIRKLAVTNCIFRDIDCSGLKIQSSEGAAIEDMVFSNLVMENVQRPILVTLNYFRERVDTPEEISTKCTLKNMRFSNIIASSKEHIDSEKELPACIIIDSVDGSMIEDMTLSNISYKIREAEKAQKINSPVLQQVTGRAEAFRYEGNLPAYGIYARNVKNLKLYDLDFKRQVEDARVERVFDNVID